MNEKLYYNAADIAAMLGISMGKSYKILREMNRDLAGRGSLRLQGKFLWSISGRNGTEQQRRQAYEL